MVGCPKYRSDGVLCSRCHFRFVLYPPFEDVFWFLDPDVSRSSTSFELKSPTLVLDVLVDVEELVESRFFQKGGPLVFSFPCDPFVSLFEDDFGESFSHEDFYTS
jgi:hypothetical protein